MTDPEGRPTVGDLVRDRVERLFHVGRLDADTEGLLLLTNDGELAHRLSHPSYEVPKTYLAEVLGPMDKGVGKQLRQGVELEDGLCRFDGFRVVDSSSNRLLLESSCTRAASTSCAARWRPSATRCSGCCARRSDRCTSAARSPARSAT